MDIGWSMGVKTTIFLVINLGLRQDIKDNLVHTTLYHGVLPYDIHISIFFSFSVSVSVNP